MTKEGRGAPVLARRLLVVTAAIVGALIGLVVYLATGGTIVR